MRYRNIKTGAIIDSPFKIFGDDWEEFKPETVAEEVNDINDHEGYVEEEINLEEMTKAELIELAKEHEIEVNEKDKKEALIEVIAKAFE